VAIHTVDCLVLQSLSIYMFTLNKVSESQADLLSENCAYALGLAFETVRR